MSEPNGYNPMPGDAERIRRLVGQKRYRNEAAVIDKALEILLAWEGSQPQDTIVILKAMMPFTPQQEAFLKEVMKEDERKRHFGETASEEAVRHGALAISNRDHKRVRANLAEAQEYMRTWSPPDPQGALEYDGYPMLFKMYSRFLPARISVSVLANMLYEDGANDVSLDDLRGSAYDIAEEVAGSLVTEERSRKARRSMKLSTGLPTKATHDDDVEKKAHAQKRFKDQYVGAVRKFRTTGERYADGALAALGLAAIFEEGGKLRVTLTELGRQLCLFDNPVLRGETNPRKAVSDDEASFILNELIPRLPLEDMFVKAAVRAVEKAGGGGITASELDRVFRKEVVRYAGKNEKKAARFGLDKLGGKGGEKEGAQVVGYRVATMGRLAELGKVVWNTGPRGESVFYPAAQ